MGGGSNVFALSELLIAERSALLRMIRRIVGDVAAAEDVSQGLYLRVRAVKDDLPIANARAYLFKLAANLATDYVRGEARRRGVAAEIDEILWVEDAAPSLDRVVEARDELARVQAAVEQLPEPTRTMFRLNRFGMVPQREIAERFGVSTTIVERHMRRALKLLGDVRHGRTR